jgi:sugar/nucleoside kinase (ribokinase family)
VTSNSFTETLVSAAPDQRRAAPSLLAVGDNVVDRYVEAGYMYPGGNAVNVAVHARRNGAASAYLGAVGTDRAGQVVLAALEEEGVDTTLTRQVGGPNAYADVRVVDGNRVFGGADVGISRFSLAREDLTAAAAFDIVHTGECSMVEEQLEDLADAARVLSFDFSERPWDYVRTHAPKVSVAIWSTPGGDRASAETRAARLSELGPSVVAITMGSGGAVLLRDGELAYSPVSPSTIVDTLGAGDAFIARLLVGLASAEPLDTLARNATRYATASCSSYGAFGHRTPLHGHEAELDPIRNGRLDLR